MSLPRWHQAILSRCRTRSFPDECVNRTLIADLSFTAKSVFRVFRMMSGRKDRTGYKISIMSFQVKMTSNNTFPKLCPFAKRRVLRLFFCTENKRGKVLLVIISHVCFLLLFRFYLRRGEKRGGWIDKIDWLDLVQRNISCPPNMSLITR